MKDCLFCQIVANQAPHYRIYEDKNNIAFLDIYPYAWGHTLLIPKKHHRWIWDIPDLGGFMETAKLIVAHYQQKLKVESAFTLAVGKMIPHAHLHLLPMVDEANATVSQAVSQMRKAKLSPQEAHEIHRQLTLIK